MRPGTKALEKSASASTLGLYLGGSFQRDNPSSHTFYMVAAADCEAGEGVTATFGAVDVIGTK